MDESLEKITLEESSSNFTLMSLFLDADIIVKSVIIILIFASIWSWTIIFAKFSTLKNLFKEADDFEESFSADTEEFFKPESVNQESTSNDNLIMSNEVSEVAGNNGKLPDDIPLDDNDDVLARQIKNAALNEVDPKKQKKLWDEYRRYKNLKIN